MGALPSSPGPGQRPLSSIHMSQIDGYEGMFHFNLHFLWLLMKVSISLDTS